jgi:carbamoyltransferase
MQIIGINNEMYISSACLICDGKITAAGAEERFTRGKLSRAFPKNAIAYCLKEAGMEVTDIDFFATSWNPGVYFKKFNPLFSGKRRHLIEQLYSVPDHLMQFYGRPDIDYVYQENAGEFGKNKVYHMTHHRTHAANGFFLSPFDTAAILTADAQGEFESTTFCQGRGSKISHVKSINYPQSLGALYSTFTEYLGFRANSDEWKVMAMASYADYKNPYYTLFKEQVVRFQDEGSIELNLSFFNGFLHEQPHTYTEKLVRTFGAPRHKDEELQDRHFEIAAALQRITEDIATHLLHWLYAQTKEQSLVLSGGSFMNSVFNGKVLETTPFEQVFISSCPDDSGNCFGAALYLYNHILEHERSEPMTHNYYGPHYSNQQIKQTLENNKLSYTQVDNICAHAAQLLAQGEIIGWFQGRMEFGQRALGNRSILADPRQVDMKDKINRAVKFRESFRPFAPAILKERQEEYFEIGAGGDVLFMEKVYRIKPQKRSAIPAVVHVDGTGRLQTVRQDTNPLFYTLILEFEKKTGIPIVLNTSFNLNGEPIVCTPQDALKTFLACGMDTLIMGNYIIHK